MTVYRKTAGKSLGPEPGPVLYRRADQGGEAVKFRSRPAVYRPDLMAREHELREGEYCFSPLRMEGWGGRVLWCWPPVDDDPDVAHVLDLCVIRPGHIPPDGRPAWER